MSVELEEGPEVEGLKPVLLTVPGVQMTVEELLAAEDEYHRTLFQLVPAPLVCTFRVKPRIPR